MPLFEHLGQDYEANLRYVQNLFWHSVGQLFRETGKLISGQTEITGKSTIDFKDLTWMSTRLLNSRAYQYSNAKACVFLCRGIISYTSYSRTNDCVYNGYVNINLEPNAMNNIDTVAHMNMHYTQY